MVNSDSSEVVVMDAEWDGDTVIGEGTTTHDWHRYRIKYLLSELTPVLQRLLSDTTGAAEAGLYRAVLDYQQRCGERE